MIRASHFDVVVKFNDGTDTMVFHVATRKIADGIIKNYRKCAFVESIVCEEN